MPVRLVAIAAIILSMYILPATGQESSAPAQPDAAAAAASPLQNPFYLFPWMANTTPALSAEINAQGLSSEWMNMQWMLMMANHFWNAPIDEATRFSILDAMLRAANMQVMEPFFGGPNQAKMWIPSQNPRQVRPNTVSESLSDEAKRNMYQSLMMLSPLSLRDMISIMADKMPVAEDVSFDDAVESMRLRANEINFKFVGHSPLWKDIVAITGDENTPRVEIFNFCDAMVARKVLDYAPEFIVFIPCRIALLEDADGQLWVMTLDWDVNWLNLAQNPNSVLDKELREEAIRIREGMRYIMEGAATGDF
ncbi:MAG: DUF302 domain-containing protein [Gammaproteobacteria bacterium]|nr:MAG: DUF302 domain-containing protein [Gammaproteobacteria bacterium]